MATVFTRIKDALQDFYEQPYRQAEALLAVDRMLQPTKPLPRMGTWAISPDFALLLANTVEARRPKVILELGGGVSTLIASYVLERQGQGHLVSVDHDAAFIEQTRANLEAHGLGSRVRWVHAPLVPIDFEGKRYQWYDLPQDLPDSIDLLVVDGPPGKLQPQSRYLALPTLASRLSSNAAVLVDDAKRRDERTMVRRWLSKFPEFKGENLPLYKGACLLTHRGGAG